MRKILGIFEDEKYVNFYPLTYLRPVYELKTGILSLKNKIQRRLPNKEIIYFGREMFNNIFEYSVNDLPDKINEIKTIQLINGRTVINENLKNKIENLNPKKQVIWLNKSDDIIFMQMDTSFFSNIVFDLLKNMSISFAKRLLQGKLEIDRKEYLLAEYPWQLFELNSSQIIEDLLLIKNEFCEIDSQNKLNYTIYGENNLYLGKSIRIEPMVFFDTEDGPIIVDDDAHIKAFSHITGPCYIGKKTVIMNGHIREGCSIGPQCRIGGEVEESIFHGYSNKYHYGFIGHSYIGEWVNLGAGTTNSDLKNNYSTVRYKTDSAEIQTNLIKAGAIIGDFTRTGIGTLINTGSILGIFCNVFNSDSLAKYVPPFSWGSNSNFQTYKLDKCLETTEKIMKRRGKELTPEQENLIRFYYGRL